LASCIAAGTFPEDWKYYTFAFPVARYRHLSWTELREEREACYATFYCLSRILRRTWDNFWRSGNPLLTVVGNLSYRKNFRLHHNACREFKLPCDELQVEARGPLPHDASATPSGSSQTRQREKLPSHG
jgi:hypothetical protein